MKVVLFLFITLSLLPGETLIDKLKDKNATKLKDSIKNNTKEESREQERLRHLTERPEPAVEGVAIELFSIDVDKNTSIGVEYAPPLKQGELIDNKEQTTIKLEHKF